MVTGMCFRCLQRFSRRHRMIPIVDTHPSVVKSHMSYIADHFNSRNEPDGRLAEHLRSVCWKMSTMPEDPIAIGCLRGGVSLYKDFLASLNEGPVRNNRS